MEKDLQRIDVKVLARAPEPAPLDPILTVFDRWRKEEDAPSDWIDLADYAHMPQGPGVMMAGKREHFAVDTNEPGVGILDADSQGAGRDRRGALCGGVPPAFDVRRRRLMGEAEWPAAIEVDGGRWVIAVNDRLQFPNNDATDAELKAGLVGGARSGVRRGRLSTHARGESRAAVRVSCGGRRLAGAWRVAGAALNRRGPAECQARLRLKVRVLGSPTDDGR